MTQEGEGIRSGSVVVQGGTMNVQVGPNETSVEISTGTQVGTTTHSVAPNKTATIPVPPVPGGTILTVTVGNGEHTRTILVEVVAPSP